MYEIIVYSFVFKLYVNYKFKYFKGNKTSFYKIDHIRDSNSFSLNL